MADIDRFGGALFYFDYVKWAVAKGIKVSKRQTVNK